MEDSTARKASERGFLLRLDEVASRLNVSIDTVRRLIKEKKLQASRIGGQWRVRPHELTRYIEKGRSCKK